MESYNDVRIEALYSEEGMRLTKKWKGRIRNFGIVCGILFLIALVGFGFFVAGMFSFEPANSIVPMIILFAVFAVATPILITLFILCLTAHRSRAKFVEQKIGEAVARNKAAKA